MDLIKVWLALTPLSRNKILFFGNIVIKSNICCILLGFEIKIHTGRTRRYGKSIHIK